MKAREGELNLGPRPSSDGPHGVLREVRNAGLTPACATAHSNEVQFPSCDF